MRKAIKKRQYTFADLMRQLLICWLVAVTVEFLLLPAELRGLTGLNGLKQMSLVRVLLITCGGTVLLWNLSRFWQTKLPERCCLAAVFAVLMVAALRASFTWAFFCVCGMVLLILVIYGLFGWDSSDKPTAEESKTHPIYGWVTAALGVAFFLFVSVWTVSRINSFCTPTYDFGIFAQMFYNMKESGLPMTTVERDGLLSHFAVHMSPIYYLMLPFYCIVPTPATLQVLQAAVLASAVIPLWKLGRLHGLSGLQRTMLCAVLLLYPAFSGGTSYDIHENCFLAPLVLWLLYGIDKKNTAITAVSAVLTLMVKEDAAVYVGIIAVYLLLRAALRHRKGEYKDLITGGVLLVGALAYFFAVTGYLAENGDGVMTYRYDNFIYDGSGSLITVIKAVLMNPMKALFECVDKEKLQFIAQTMLPLLGLPLITRRYERYILLIPYILVNLMSDYQYQHDIFFQYTFGATACLIYLAAVNLADLRISAVRVTALAAAVAVSIGFFTSLTIPKATYYTDLCSTYAGYYEEVGEVLDTIPEGASVTATTFYTTRLSQREVLYDIMYCSREHLLSTEYVALSVTSASNYRKYATNGQNGFQNVVKLLESNGYELYAQRAGTVVIYRNPDKG